MRTGAFRMRHYLRDFRLFIRHGNQLGLGGNEFLPQQQLRLFGRLWQRLIKQQPQFFRLIWRLFPSRQLSTSQPTAHHTWRNRRRLRRCSRSRLFRQRFPIEIIKDSSGVLRYRLIKRTTACFHAVCMKAVSRALAQTLHTARSCSNSSHLSFSSCTSR
jgi:hypothetical protein